MPGFIFLNEFLYFLLRMLVVGCIQVYKAISDFNILKYYLEIRNGFINFDNDFINEYLQKLYKKIIKAI